MKIESFKDLFAGLLLCTLCIAFGGLGLVYPSLVGSFEYRLLDHYYLSYPMAMMLYGVVFVAGIIPFVVYLRHTSPDEGDHKTKTLEHIKTNVLLGKDGEAYLVLPPGRLQPGQADLFLGNDVIMIKQELIKQEGGAQT